MDQRKKTKTGLYVALVWVLLFSGCTSNNGTDQEESLIIAGSTTVQPVAAKAAEVYMAEKNIEVTVQGGGSGTGIKMVSEGSADIGSSSREIKESEYQGTPDLTPYEIAADGIAIIVNPDNAINGLSKEQIRDIFSGEITNFKEIGGSDLEIVVIIREEGSGTRSAFEELVMGDSPNTAGAEQQPSNGAVKASVKSNPNAIGYVGAGYVDDSVKALEVDGTLPTTESIKSGEYPISRKLYLITNGPATGETKDFIDFILSGEGQEIVEEEGFVSVS